MSKFSPIGAFDGADGSYELLPFRFTRLNDDQYVLSNMVGEYLLATRPTIDALVGHRLASDTKEYDDLKSKHFLRDVDSAVAVELLALKARTRLRRLSNFTGLHIFVVSLRCEHSCPYCQVSRQSDDRLSFDMTQETASKALDLVFRSPSPTLKIEFQGGEPLLNFELIRFIVESALARNVGENARPIEFVITTNLALVTDEILQFCKLHNILISTSLDGPRDLHNANRPRPGKDSYERAVDGIRRAREVLGHDRVGALMTTTRASLERGVEIVDEYIKQGFDNIFFRPLSPYGFAVKTKTYLAYDMREWLDFYFKSLNYIIELNKSGKRVVEGYAAIILTRMLTPFDTGYVDLISPAGIGIGAVVYNYDGDVYASDESRMLSEMGDEVFRLGNVHSSSYSDIFLSDALLGPIEESFAASAPMCSDCAFEPYCGADPVFHYATQGDMVGRKPESAFCQKNMTIFKTLISMMENDAEVKSIFRKWVAP